jgi:hypothetical protein
VGNVYSRFCEPMFGDKNLDRGALRSGTRKNIKHVIATRDYHFDKGVQSSILRNLITCSGTINVGLHVIS